MYEVFLVDYEALSKQPLWLFYCVASSASLLCFFFLYLIADDHLNRSLELLAKQCKMSPAMAGLTLLALGNGASDFFTAIIGVNDSPGMILGSSVGSGLFITCAILGFTIVFSRSANDVGKMVSVSDLPNQGVLVARGPFLRSAVIYILCSCVILFWGYKGQISLWQPIALVCGFGLYIACTVYGHVRGQKTVDLPELGKEDSTQTLVLEALLDQVEAESAWNRFLWVTEQLIRLRMTSVKDTVVSLIKFPIVFLLSVTIPPLENEESDNAKEVAVNRYIDHVRRIVFPVGVACLFILVLKLFGFDHGLVFCGIFSLAVVCCLLTIASLDKKWREPQSPGVLSVIGGFVCSLFWIYLVTKELLSGLTAIGKASGVDDAVLGLTILAWGNSCGDLIGNIALAQNGHAETAIIAALSGPIQNVLLTLGISFTVACFQAPGHVVKLERPEMTFYLTTLSLLLCLGLLLLTVPFVFRYRLTRVLGFGLLAGYGAYLVAGLALVVNNKK